METVEEVQDSSKGPGKHSIRDTIDPDLIAKWESVQENMRQQIITTDDAENWSTDLKHIKLVAGLDISYPLEVADSSKPQSHGVDTYAFAAIVIISYPSLSIVYKQIEKIEFDVPYVPGFLAFRESVPLIRLVQEAIAKDPNLRPDVLLVDGNGILHPQQCGSACHIGFHTGIPTIGVAKNLFQIDGIDCTRKTGQNMLSVGHFVHIRDTNAKILGMALKTATDAKNPVYVSVGHKISLESARQVVLAVSKFRVPEPIRHADYLSREFIRKTEKEEAEAKSKGNKK
jgi:deoxyribonuclease V